MLLILYLVWGLGLRDPRTLTLNPNLNARLLGCESGFRVLGWCLGFTVGRSFKVEGLGEGQGESSAFGARVLGFRV